MFSANRTINGTWGEVWVDGHKIAECYKCQAKYSHETEDVPALSEMVIDRKIVGTKGTGSLGIYKVFSRFSEFVDALMQGRDVRAVIIIKLSDPDAYGAERVALYNVSFDDFTLMNFEAKAVSKIEIPFTFTRHEYLDRIEA